MLSLCRNVGGKIEDPARSVYDRPGIDTVIPDHDVEMNMRTIGISRLTHFPDLLPLSAWAKFRRWLLTNPRLKGLLASKSRSFTPAQVALIFSELGEP